MSLVIVGTNHRYSPVRLREKIFFSKKRLQDALDFLKETGALKAGVILSTCNRVEIYGCADTTEIGAYEIKSFISRYYEIDGKDIYPYLYIYRDMDAARHLFRVASGLDSLILGETQILSQVKAAFCESEKNGFVDYPLNEVFDSAVSAANRIHRETEISKGKLSIGSVAVDFIRNKIGSFSGKNILIIGVGKVTELVLKYLRKEKSDVIFISNRTFEKARSLASQIGAKAVRFDNLRKYLEKADIVITATKSPHFIINKETIEEAVRQKRLLIIDLALPRDVDPEVRDIDGIELFDLEDLGAAIQKNRDRKNVEAQKSTQIIELEVKGLWEHFSELEQEKALLP
ncbi:MAG: glutamyl-tRNA reductase [Candidatus Omnitrophica bacterium]|nr:glutamyl-tRNA reductase [Candidatus Omnitrophota bacterium]MBU4149018.1 glutamyl-tRNA reductase [Candidatus Omnitrophota bacterium]